MTQQLGQTNLGWAQKQLNKPKFDVEQPQSDTKATPKRHNPPIATKANPKNLISVARTRRNGRL